MCVCVCVCVCVKEKNRSVLEEEMQLSVGCGGRGVEFGRRGFGSLEFGVVGLREIRVWGGVASEA